MLAFPSSLLRLSVLPHQPRKRERYTHKNDKRSNTSKTNPPKSFRPSTYTHIRDKKKFKEEERKAI